MKYRNFCYNCRRAQSSCMCKYCKPIETKTRFVILMHPMERQKVKNGTGKITQLQLSNSEIIEGIDFSENEKVNKIIRNSYNDCFVLYPKKNSINLSDSKICIESMSKHKKRVIFILDATWPCAKKILRLSKNIVQLRAISFDSTYESNFQIKQQPNSHCLSTIESTQEVLKNLNNCGLENCDISNFTLPFEKMVEYQLKCEQDPNIRRYQHQVGLVNA